MKVYYDDYGSGTVFLCEKCYELLTNDEKAGFECIENNFRSNGELISGLYYCEECRCELQVLNIGVNIGQSMYKADDLTFYDKDVDPETGRVYYLKIELDLFNMMNDNTILRLVSVRTTKKHSYGEVVELLVNDIKNELKSLGVERFDDTLDDVFDAPTYETVENRELFDVIHAIFRC